jgi:uncharacterized repeat protein (TIGR03803 family)
MAVQATSFTLLFGRRFSPGILITTSGLLLILLLLLPAQAQTFSVLHTFTGSDGAFPYSGVTIDAAGHLYGTTSRGGSTQNGVAYELKHAGSGWTESILHNFGSGSDGIVPYAAPVVGPSGILYGTASIGGSGNGVVYSLQPPPTVCTTVTCPWTERLLWTFQGADGSLPAYGALTFDQSGNGYGTTQYGGSSNNGTVYEVSRQGQQWIETLLYSFGTGQTDGTWPLHNVVFDRVGNLYGTTYQGGTNGGGAVFELSPSGSGWTEQIIANFPAGSAPQAGLIIDSAGNLYGATDGVGTSSAEVFELSPSGNGWTLSTLHSFTTNRFDFGPVGNLVMDHSGNLYGATYSLGSHSEGNIFELTPSGSGWTYTDLYDFTGGSDGSGPIGDLNIDASGNLYGTTQSGGSGMGVVWKLAP